MVSNSHSLESIVYKNGELLLLNQLLLPHQTVYEKVNSIEDGYHQIKDMKVRGAPAIAITGALSLIVELRAANLSTYTADTFLPYLQKSLAFLRSSRPTAVNLSDACNRIWSIAGTAKGHGKSVQETVDQIAAFAEDMLRDDRDCCLRIGEFGKNWILEKSGKQTGIRVLTHCNTGALATGGHGTALGIIRSLAYAGNLEHAYCTETRPYNQGSRLTAYELLHEKIPSTLITDSMVSFLLATSQKKENPITAIVVGADRIASNGDTANKIGTYQLAVTAKRHNVLMIVAATVSSIDFGLKSGDAIPIETRKTEELTQVAGVLVENGKVGNQTAKVQVAPVDVQVWNPGFDVTPCSLIDAIVTEYGVCVKENGKDYFELTEFLEKAKA